MTHLGNCKYFAAGGKSAGGKSAVIKTGEGAGAWAYEENVLNELFVIFR